MTRRPNLLLQAVAALVLMGAAAAVTWALTPTVRLATVHGILDLDKVVPRQFGDWRQETAHVSGIVNPQQQAQLNLLYSKILTRVYVDSQGERMMLSIAYGEDQRDAAQLHYPEVCYPAQGFQIEGKQAVSLQAASLNLPAMQLRTELNASRYEPVTYWTVIGDQAVRGGMEKKLAEVRYGLKGLIPDGLLFRVSSIDRDPSRAFGLQSQFASQLLASVDPKSRARLAGHGRAP